MAPDEVSVSDALWTPPDSGKLKGQTVAEAQETQQEKQARWEAQRIARDQEQRERQAAHKRKTTRTWFIVGAVVIIVAVIVKVVLL